MARRTRITVADTIDLRSRRRRNHPARLRNEHPAACRLTVVQPVAKTALTPGTVVWAHVPYEETDGGSCAPSSSTSAVAGTSLCSPAPPPRPGTATPGPTGELTDLETAGLPRATGVELAVVTIDVTDVVSVAGALGRDDRLVVLGGDHDDEGEVAA